jgi:hypothetical protein
MQVGNTYPWVILLGAITQWSHHPYLADNGFRFKMAHSPGHVPPLFFFQPSRLTSWLVELVELSLQRVPLDGSFLPLSMTSTTHTPSLSTPTRSPFQRPVFTRQEKDSVPSSGCSNIGLSSGTDSTVSEEDGDEDTIVRWGWVWYKGEMRKISELPPAEPPKPSPPKRKVRFTHLDRGS